MEAKGTLKNVKWSTFTKKYGTLVALILICIFFTICCPDTFLTKTNIITVLRQISILAVMGAGMTVVMITGGIDLSCGYIVSFCGIIAAALYQNYGFPVWASAIGAMIFGCIIGMFNGWLVAYVRIPAFICTMSSAFLIQGMNQAYTQGYPISGLNKAFNCFALDSTFGISNAIYIMAVFLVVIYVLLNHTKFGRNCYAMGGNIEATMMSGVNVRRTQLLAYVISGFGMAVASLILLSRLGAAHPTAADGYNMTCVAVVFLGSTMFREGEHNLLGSLFGALIMGVLVNGMTLMNIQYYYQNIAQGAVILLAVAVSSIMRAKKK